MLVSVCRFLATKHGAMTLQRFPLKTRFLLLTLLFVLFSVGFVHAQGETYTIPPDPEGMDASQMVARIGDEIITLGELRTRIRYERFYYYFVLEEFIARQGAQVINLDDPANVYANSVQQLINTLVNKEQFTDPIYQTIILEHLYHQEAVARGITPDECKVNEFWALLLNMQDQFVDCQLPEGFAEKQAVFLQRAELYSGITPEMVTNLLTARAEYDLVSTAIGDEYVVPDVPTVRSRQILVEDETTANDVLERLKAGEDFQTLLLEYTQDAGAEGNGGSLGMIQRGQSGYGTAFDDAAFNAEINAIVGPVQTDAGFHVLQVTDQQSTPRVRARHILFDNEADANTAIRLINSGQDFAALAQEYSLDPGSKRNGGDLGFFEREQMVAEFSDAAFNAEIGQIVGPVQTEFGYHIIEVLEKDEQLTSVNVQHILVATEEEAQTVIERLNAGEDFATVAREVSLDYRTRGHGGDSGLLLARLAEPGFYAQADVLSTIGDAVFAAQPGDFVGPIETARGFYVLEVQEFSTRPPTTQEAETQRSNYASDWQDQQLESDRVEQTDFWTWDEYIPDDPIPSAVSEQLKSLDAELEQAAADLAEVQAQNTIPNILRELQAPETGNSSE